ncbi:MAG: hypothetical protein I8H77_05695 [Comamonadaceae bacterium]|nr:hypothetical protein [Comamonadaceae bacterium]
MKARLRTHAVVAYAGLANPRHGYGYGEDLRLGLGTNPSLSSGSDTSGLGH